MAFTGGVTRESRGESVRRARRARLRPGDADDDARIGVGSGVGAEPPGSAVSGRAHLNHDGSVEGGATRARGDRESRIADRVACSPYTSRE